MKYNTERFLIKWYHCFSHPFFFIRLRLSESVKKYALQLSGSVMDFGCGSKPYRSYFSNASIYTGVDIEVSGHSHVNEHIDVFYNGSTLPFENNSFDHIFSSEVFEHVFNIDEILPELYRVLKPGGYILITCPFSWPEHEQPYDYCRYSSFGITYLLEKKGFKVLQLDKTGSYVETLSQLFMLFIYYFLPKKPGLLYLILHQVFILPIIVITSLLSRILPAKIKRKDLYMNNVILAVKPQ